MSHAALRSNAGQSDPLAFAVELARRAGLLLRERIDGPRDIVEKAHRNDLVTDADRASEALIVAAIRERFPSASVLGEEGGDYAGSANERWIIDPLDGTTNYAHRYPLFCVSIAYERGGVVEAGAVYAPMLDMLFAGERGGGATCNGERIHVSDANELAGALACTGFLPWDYDANADCFADVARIAQGVRRGGAAALDLSLVAAGRLDAFWEWDLRPWDVAAGALIVTEAGGRATAIDGSPLVLGGPILATNGRALHQRMVDVLTTARARYRPQD